MTAADDASTTLPRAGAPSPPSDDAPNTWREPTRSVRVVDLVIARSFGGHAGRDHTITRKGELVGTLKYTAPEQILGLPTPDPRCDISGEAPFVDSDETSIARAILHQTTRSLRTTRPDVPAGVERIVLRCLRKDARPIETALIASIVFLCAAGVALAAIAVHRR